MRLITSLQSKPQHLDIIPKCLKSIEGKKLGIRNNTFNKSDLDTLEGQSWLNDKVVHAYLDSMTGRAARSDGVANFVLPCFVALGWQRGQYNQFLYPQVSVIQ